MKIAELSRTVAFRLTLFFSMFFTACVILLLGVVYWQTAAEMTRRVDLVITLEQKDFSFIHDVTIPDEIAKRIQRDQRHIYFYGLFNSDGQWLAGNVPLLPQSLPKDGNIYQISQFLTSVQERPIQARALVMLLDSGKYLLLGHDVQQLVEFGEIMKGAFFWGGSLTILLGLLFGLALSFRPLRRIEQIQQVCALIMRGDFKQRLLVSKHRDELDMLATIVNKMLDEIERLMSEVKGVGDNIAHDLRTPLTRLRAILYRVSQQLGDASIHRPMMDQVIVEVDSLLLRFRALLRISEIESKQRRAGFKLIQLSEILEQAVNFVEPLADEKSIHMSLAATQVDPVQGDGELLFEAFANLLDNAIKFTPAGGKVTVRLMRKSKGPQVEIIDTGCGVGDSERNVVLNRFYRGNSGLQAPGHGLGLSIVMAIVRLHDFKFELSAGNPGTRAIMFCWAQEI